VSGVPAFGMIPKSRKLKQTPHLENGSVLSESFRTLHSNIFLKQPKAKTILVSSSVPGEGKSTVSCNLAATAASWGWGEKVLLVDLDLRRPRVGEILGINPEQKGACDCLKGLCSIDDAIVSYPNYENFDVMVGGIDRFKNGLPDDRALAELLKLVQTKYGRVIIDTAPVLAVNDTLVMAKHVDIVCLVFKMWKTPRKALARALTQLEGNSSYPAGVISNFMPNRKGLGQYGYYYSYSGTGYQSYA
ncbi:MAG: CpsD/CapB family tyrosine-protein kinase, partial [Verrucomicrobiota bacterium]